MNLKLVILIYIYAILVLHTVYANDSQPVPQDSPGVGLTAENEYKSDVSQFNLRLSDLENIGNDRRVTVNGINDLKDRINLLEEKLNKLDFDKRIQSESIINNKNSITTHFTVFSWLTGGLIAIMTLFSGGSIAYSIYELREIKKRNKEASDEWDKLLASITEEKNKAVKHLYQESMHFFKNLSSALALRYELENSPPDLDAIYGHLQNVIYSMRPEYKPLIKSVRARDFDKEINKLADSVI